MDRAFSEQDIQQFYLGPNKPIWEQVSRENVLNDLMENHLDKMDLSIADLLKEIISRR